jgi:putative ATP-dependent endonuclease of the OLD family
MFIDKLYIKNYRCFRDTPTIIEFSKSGLTALIGPNNVGKSTVLKILDILFGDKWPSGRFSEDDFNNNELSKDIILAGTFIKEIKIVIKDYALPVKGVVVRARSLSTGYGESSIDVDYRLLESDDNIENLNFETLDIANYRTTYGRGNNPIYIGQEIKNQLPIVITIPLIKLHTEQPTNKWSVLGRMLQKVENEFVVNIDRKNSFEEKIKEAVGVLRIKEFNEIEKDIQTFWDKIKPANLTGTELKFLEYEPWRYYRQFKLSVKQNNKDVPLETLGEGVQRLAIIALYRTYLKKHGRNERAILLIEEPESYLHPQARKTLFRILRQAIQESEETEGQIIYTTHSENFIDCGYFDDVVILLKQDDGVITRHLNDETLKKHTISLGQPQSGICDQHIHYRLIEAVSQGLKEALFTNKSVIVEGPSEIELFKFFSDVEEEQIGIISAGGKSNIPSIYSFLTAFGVPCLVVMDKDSEGRDKERNETDNTKIVNILSQVKALIPDSTKINISLDEIERIKDGEIFPKSRLLVFCKNLEGILDAKINGWPDILKILRRTFNLPSGKTKLGPRDIRALGLSYRGEYEGNVELSEVIVKSNSCFVKLTKVLNEFIKQEVEIPNLLIPKNEE